MSIVGVDLGGTKTSAAIVESDGQLGAVTTLPTRAADGPDVVLDQVAKAIRLALGNEPLSGIGVGTAGAVNPETGVIVSATDTFPGWLGTNIIAGLQERFGAVPVTVRNDVDAHGLGEAWCGAAAGQPSLLMVAAGTGVGGAIILDGVLRTGAHCMGGEIGHIPARGADGLICTCGREGHLEALAAGPAIHRRYLALGGSAELRDTRAVVAAAVAGDELAHRVVVAAAAGLGRAVAGLATALDPDIVVVGGGLAQAGDLWWQAMESGFRAELVPAFEGLPIVPAALGPSAAIVGAGAPLLRASV